MYAYSKTVATAVALASFLGCGGGSTVAVGRASAAPEPITQAVVAIDAGPALATEKVVSTRPRERRMLEYIPSEYELVMHLSLASFLNTEFFHRHERTLLKEFTEVREELVNKCQIDPLYDIDSVTVAINLSKSDPELLVALATGIGATRVEECVRASGGQVEAGQYKSDGEPVSYYWPTEDVVLLSTDKSSEEIMLALRTGRSLDNPALMEFLSRTDRFATVWGGGLVPPSIASGVGFGGVPRGVVVRGSVWAGVDISLDLTFDSSDAADKMMNLLKMGMGTAGQDEPFRELLESIDTEQVGTSVHIDVQISPELAGNLVDEL